MRFSRHRRAVHSALMGFRERSVFIEISDDRIQMVIDCCLLSEVVDRSVKYDWRDVKKSVRYQTVCID